MHDTQQGNSHCDLMSCFYRLNNKLLILSAGGTLFLLLLNITGNDKVITRKLSVIFDIDINVSYWLLYLVSAFFFLVINLIFTYVQFKNRTIKPDDWDSIKKDIFKKRAIYNFSTKQTELMIIPRYMYFIFLFSVLFIFVSVVNELIFSPVDILLSSTTYENIFSFHKNDHPLIFLFVITPPYIFLWLMFFLGKVFKR